MYGYVLFWGVGGQVFFSFDYKEIINMKKDLMEFKYSEREIFFKKENSNV